MKTTIALLGICAVWPALASAQDSQAAAERARLAEQRIQAELAARAAAEAPADDTTTTDSADERSRLGNERIQAEVVRRQESSTAPAPTAPAAAAREELGNQRIQAEIAARASDVPAANGAVATAPPPVTTTGAPLPTVILDEPPRDIDALLERLRALGELRDAGYLTDSEFAELKQRVIDSSD